MGDEAVEKCAAIEPGGEAEAAVDVPAVGKRPGLQARLPELLGERRPLRRASVWSVFLT